MPELYHQRSLAQIDLGRARNALSHFDFCVPASFARVPRESSTVRVRTDEQNSFLAQLFTGTSGFSVLSWARASDGNSRSKQIESRFSLEIPMSWLVPTGNVIRNVPLELGWEHYRALQHGLVPVSTPDYATPDSITPKIKSPR
jgi:hypothetical protein